ncbi:hypothetical protein CCHR01_02195 [Colletotrichum chrysophilum]|uniref:Uncharacterized protein n=1 Tax=Colletotrichum chrysophilum TaxID=1836956 RepID=A0AAD9AW61_9PEZI|nr:hypothetical protein CCHR01_02195 [Colletotrichum chrysophilum]
MTKRAVVVLAQVIPIFLWVEDLLAKLTRSEAVDLDAMVLKTIQRKSATTYVAHCLPMLFEMIIQISDKHDHVADVALLKVHWKGTDNRKEGRFAREECSRELAEVTLRCELRLAIHQTFFGLLQVGELPARTFYKPVGCLGSQTDTDLGQAQERQRD